jgi:hypothetical protein
MTGARGGRPVRVANCSGFFGDRMSALAEVVRGGEIDVVTGDYLAEVTMLVLAKLRLKDPGAGYAGSFLKQIQPVLGEIASRGIKVVVNAGGLNPAALAPALRQLCEGAGVRLTIAHVEGDDITGRLAELQASGHALPHLDTGAPIAEWPYRPLTANAYLGGWGIARALSEGADIVICPRVTDASLVVGAAAWWHEWEIDAWDPLAGAVIAGHVIECGTQATGGNFSGVFGLNVDMRRPGFPIAEIAADGSSRIVKHAGTGGAITVDTVLAQLLYEIQGLDYLNPDVTTRLDSLSVAQAGPDAVEISGIRGAPPPPTTKVSVTALGGFQNGTVFVLTGLDADRKAALMEEALSGLLHGRPGLEELRFERIGATKPNPATQLEASTFLRVSVRGSEEAVGRAFFNAVVEVSLANYAGLFSMSGDARGAKSYGVYWPAVVPQSELSHRVVFGDGRAFEIGLPPCAERSPRVPAAPAPTPAHAGETRMTAIGTIANARSGDKGGNANIGLWVKTGAQYDWLVSYLTPERLRQLLPEAGALEVRAYPLPNLLAINFVIVGLLDGGATETLRFDAQAKALGEYVRAKEVPIPVVLLS